MIMVTITVYRCGFGKTFGQHPRNLPFLLISCQFHQQWLGVGFATLKKVETVRRINEDK